MITFTTIETGFSFNGSMSDLTNILRDAISTKREYGNEAAVGYSIQYADSPDLLVTVSVYHVSANNALRRLLVDAK